jgi:asparagine synthase (glutamine-hydrolysing)
VSPLAGVLEAGSLVGGPWDSAAPPRAPLCLFEGAIFNLEEVAASLGRETGGDPADLLLAAHGRWGEGMLARLRGSFALLVHDPRARSTLLACDQLGGRSLFLHRAGARLAFATEMRDLLRLLPTRPGPDRASLLGWLAGTSAKGDGTLYEGVERLGAGTLLRVADCGLEARRYWSPSYLPPAQLSRGEAAAAARELMVAAVRRQLPEGTEAGILLSGGLDSSSVAALGQARMSAGKPRAYSAVFPAHPSIDESGLIKDVVADLGLAHTSLSVGGGSMVAGSLEYLREWELPPASPNHFLWQPLLLRAAREGVALMLDGEGGDELWQMSPFLLADRLRSGRPLAAARLARTMAGDRFRGWRSVSPYLRTYALRGALPASAHDALRRRHGPARYAPGWFPPASAKLLFEREDPWAWKRLDGPRWWAYMADLLTGARERLGVSEYLRHRATMAGLEDRHPLIDLDLVEFALGLDPTLALDPPLDRPLLREAMAGCIPDSIRLRPQKSYFTSLFGACLGGRDLALVRGLLDGRAEVGRYVDLEAVRQQLLGDEAAARRGDPVWGWPIWRLVTAECWLRSQGNDGLPNRLLDRCATDEDDWALSSDH